MPSSVHFSKMFESVLWNWPIRSSGSWLSGQRASATCHITINLQLIAPYFNTVLTWDTKISQKGFGWPMTHGQWVVKGFILDGQIHFEHSSIYKYDYFLVSSITYQCIYTCINCIRSIWFWNWNIFFKCQSLTNFSLHNS